MRSLNLLLRKYATKEIATMALLSLSLPGVNADSGSTGGVPTWLAYVTGGVLVAIVIYYCCRKAGFDESLQQPLLGGYNTTYILTCLNKVITFCCILSFYFIDNILKTDNL